MLPKKERAQRQDITTVLEHGTTYHSLHLRLHVCPSNTLKVSFVVPRKMGLNAVHRNTLRRRGYAAFRSEYSSPADTYTAVFFFKKGAETISADELRQEIRSLLDKVTRAGYNTH